ncbi:hypothetical protein KFK09_017340 [Dendrobium nobile]|uniref:Uncharacterized protein n=1 Tax=Dendrobium nobile TaxID=94219 RepID=A0A8T3B1Z0_DENNO|nr:hypothetical protein KFK09_017340 [Dendrobium nobile]
MQTTDDGQAQADSDVRATTDAGTHVRARTVTRELDELFLSMSSRARARLEFELELELDI